MIARNNVQVSGYYATGLIPRSYPGQIVGERQLLLASVKDVERRGWICKFISKIARGRGLIALVAENTAVKLITLIRGETYFIMNEVFGELRLQFGHGLWMNQKDRVVSGRFSIT